MLYSSIIFLVVFGILLYFFLSYSNCVNFLAKPKDNIANFSSSWNYHISTPRCSFFVFIKWTQGLFIMERDFLLCLFLLEISSSNKEENRGCWLLYSKHRRVEISYSPSWQDCWHCCSSRPPTHSQDHYKKGRTDWGNFHFSINNILF